MSASDDLKILNELIKDPNVRAGGSARYKNKSYTLAQLVAERDKVSKQVEAQQSARAKTEQEALQFTQAERDAQKEETRILAGARGQLKAALENLNIAIDRNGDVASAQEVVGEAYRALQSVNPQDKMLKGVVIPGVSRRGADREGGTEAVTSGAGTSLATADTLERAAIEAEQKRLAEDKSLVVDKTEEVTKNGVTFIRTFYKNGTVKDVQKVVSGGSDITPKVGATTDQPERKAFVDAELVARKLEDTPANRAMLRKEYNAKPATVPGDWEADLRTYMPGKAWMLELDRTKYTQLFDLLQRASDQNYYATPEGRNRFLGELDGTDFFKEIATSKQLGEIKKLVGDVGFDSVDFSKFVSDSINFGWTGDTLKAKTYEEVFRKNSDGSYSNPTAVKRATQGNDYLNMQIIAKNYFNEAPQSTIENILTGGITVQDFQRQQRTMAKQRYGHLSDLIDQGVTLEDLAANYKASAAKLLEMDPNQIDMSQGDYEVALSYGEEGKKRAMTTGEWEKLLRTDQRYGWEKTNNAKTEARSLASNIAQAFGRII